MTEGAGGIRTGVVVCFVCRQCLDGVWGKPGVQSAFYLFTLSTQTVPLEMRQHCGETERRRLWMTGPGPSVCPCDAHFSF